MTMLGVATNLRVSVVALLLPAVFLVACGGGVDAVADGEEGEGGSAGDGPAGTGPDTTSSTGALAGSGGDATGAGGDTSGPGGGPPALDCAPDDGGGEIVGCGFAPDLAIIGADDAAAYVVTAGVGGTARTYRVDLATGEKAELYHDTYSGAGAVARARNHVLLDGSVYTILNRVQGGGVDTGIFRLGGGEPETIVPFGVTQYTHLVGAQGEIFYEGGQGISGVFSVRVADRETSTWLEHDGCDSCVISGGLVGASYDGEPEAIAVYVAGDELYRIPNTGESYSELDDALAREAALAPRAPDGSYLGGEVYVPFDAGFGGMHRIDVIAPFDGAKSTLVEVADVGGSGPPRFLEVRVEEGEGEVLYIQTSDRYGSIGRIDAETGEQLPLANGPAFGDGPLRTSGNWVYFTKVRGGDDGPIEGVVVRARLD